MSLILNGRAIPFFRLCENTEIAGVARTAVRMIKCPLVLKKVKETS
jgi:hypothetical protein